MARPKGSTKLPPDDTVRLRRDLSLIAVLQGWNVTAQEIEDQINRARESGCEDYIVARIRIDQSWTPKLHTASLPNASSSPTAR